MSNPKPTEIYAHWTNRKEIWQYCDDLGVRITYQGSTLDHMDRWHIRDENAAIFIALKWSDHAKS